MAAAMICRFLVSLHCLHRFDLPDRAEDCANWCRNSVFEGTDGDGRGQAWACFPSSHVLLAVGPGFSVCLFELQRIQPKESIAFEEQESWTTFDYVRFDHMWAPKDVRYSDVWICLDENSKSKTYMGVTVLLLSSLHSRRTPWSFWLGLELF